MQISRPPTGEALNYDGERFVPGADPDSEALHFHRYLALLDVVQGRDVLDIASGEGFGAWFMHHAAQSVTGVDVSAEAVHHSQERYGNERLRFLQGDCSAIPIEDQSVDVVVSLETIEHILDHQGFLSEVRRVLRPNGVFIVSTPDKEGYGASLDQANPFHAKELTQQEFCDLIGANFSNFAIYDQGLKLVSVLWPKEETELADQPWIDFTGPELVHSKTVTNPVIQIAVASDGELPKVGGLLQQFPYPFPISAISGGAGERVVETVLKRLNDRGVEESAFSEGAPADRILAALNFVLEQSEEGLLLVQSEDDRRALEEAAKVEREANMRAVSLLVGQISDLQDEMAQQGSRFRALQQDRAVENRKRYTRKIKIYRAIANITTGKFSKRMAEKRRKYEGLLQLLNTPPTIPTSGDLMSGSIVTPSHMRLVAQILRLGQPKSIVTTGDDIVVSIIIPVFNQLAYTLGCLRSLLNHESAHRFEVIVVDDCSTDETDEEIRRIPWVRYIRSAKNGGFIESCNAGAALAKGRFVLFLNNDTKVLPGWLDELVLTFETFPNAGLVGSKLLYPDGTLQEAGGIMWRDGSAWNFGRNQDPARPEFCYTRKVDYCSGASIILPRALFEELGGFDRHYAPAYCEDSDLAMRVRQSGLDVMYQPLSKLVHFEGITSGTDLGSGAKAYQVVNKDKLFDRWKDVLASRPENAHNPDNAKDFGLQKRLLVIDAITPEPDKDAGSITCLEIMRAAQADGYQITFIPSSNYNDMPKYTATLQRMGIESLYGPFVTDLSVHLAEFGSRYDAILVYRVGILWSCYNDIKKFAPQARVIYQTSDLHHIRESREAELTGDTAIAKRALVTKKRELELVKKCDCTIVHSLYEKEYLLGLVPDAQIEVFNWVLDSLGTDEPFASRSGLMFLGGYKHVPNIDAVHYFLDEVWPLVAPRLPDATFYVVGSHLPDDLARRAADRVEMVGFVEDLRPIMDRCRMSVVPLRFGAGTKGKLAMSLAYGLPAVTTSVGAEGMGLVDGDCVYVADDPQTFADRIVALHEDPAQWSRMSKQAVAYVDDNLSREVGNAIIRRALNA